MNHINPKVPVEIIHDILKKIGTIVEIRQIAHRRNIMANMRWTNEWTPTNVCPNIEFLFLVERK